MGQSERPIGMRTFIIIWIGQVLSLLGTAMSQFGFTIWVYKETGQATPLALIGFFYVVPMVVLSPTAGAIVDRSNRKLMMMVSDLAAGLMTILQLVLLTTGRLEIWHLYVTATIVGAFQTFQWPAFSAAITMILPKEQYGRANGLLELANSGSVVFAPMLAGVLLGAIGLSGILVIDIVTFFFAVSALFLVHIPEPAQSEAGREGKGSLWTESAYGFRYIWARRSLLGLQLVFTVSNFFAGIGLTLLAPMILARTGNNEMVFASVQSSGAIGGVVGALVMSTWGGPRRRVHGVLGGWIAGSLAGQTLLGLGRSLPVWAVASASFGLVAPIVNASNQSIWQSKTAPDVQGRVFAVRRLIAWAVMPLAQLVSGPLADQVFEPAMMPEGSLVDTFGWLVGVGAGAGMALMLVFSGIAAALVGVTGYAMRAVRDAEEILPDHGAGLNGLPERITIE